MHEFEVELSCTGGKNQPHSLRRLGKLVWRSDLNAVLSQLGFAEHTAGPDFEAVTGRVRRRPNGDVIRQRFTAVVVAQTKRGTLWTIKCPTCKREVRRHEAELLKVVQVVIETGCQDLLNISLWP